MKKQNAAKRRRNAFFLNILWLMIFSVSINPFSVHAAQVDHQAEAEARKLLPIQTNEIENWPHGPEIGADAAILMDADTGTILYAKNIYAQEYPASITKLITSVLAVENSSMNDIVTFSYDAVFSVPYDGSKIGMDMGQELTMEQALYGVLVGSANEVANAVAEHISGTMDDFAVLMTEHAALLGCVNTHFVNANGLPDPDHYTCAYDMALIAREFFSYEILCKMSSTYYYYIAPTDKQPDEIEIYSHNRLLANGRYAYEYLVGSKTGYTDSARQTLVSCAERDGMRLICVVMKEESPYQFEDTVALFDYGFQNFQRLNIAQYETTYSIDDSDFFDTTTDIFGSSQPIMSLDTSDYVVIPVTIDFEDLTCTLSYNCEEEDAIAKLSYSYHGQAVGSTYIRLVQSTPNTFTFDPPDTDTSLQEIPDETSAGDEEQVIFINVKDIILRVLGIAAGAAVLFYIISYLRSYHFSEKRRDRLRRKRRKKDMQAKRMASNTSHLNFRQSHGKRTPGSTAERQVSQPRRAPSSGRRSGASRTSGRPASGYGNSVGSSVMAGSSAAKRPPNRFAGKRRKRRPLRQRLAKWLRSKKKR